MITLKAALIAASTVGTLSVGGGVTWAMTGANGDAAATAGASAPTTAARDVADGARPTASPTCVPVPGAKVPEPGAQPPTGTPRVDLPTEAVESAKARAKELARNGLPNADVPTGAAGDAVDGAKEKAAELRREADGLPTCPAPGPDAPAGAPSGAPDARVPAKPTAPEAAVPRLDCDALDPAVRVGGRAEKALMLTKGLRHEATSRAARDLGGEKVCTVTQKWTGAAGRWLSVQRVQTPSGVTEDELREGLRLPSGGTPVTVAGAAAWQMPGGHGVLVYDPSGYSLHVHGSPALGQVEDVATALREAR
ncbi:hypothetical protein [Actinomadura algeriensis]|uniref:DUF4367 domain-containing protein n=1 Tax=Actinomadura algeriensis TaxID=1679523 RepID=A0ABR9JM10_9ACTN|nr:hypothetical protein [Actinomadura algeriensis]MBE1531592.1 hypothetical protein [Actinomadura algeriensis]